MTPHIPPAIANNRLYPAFSQALRAKADLTNRPEPWRPIGFKIARYGRLSWGGGILFRIRLGYLLIHFQGLDPAEPAHESI